MSKSVLYIGYVWPEPTSSGAGVRTWNLLEAFLGQNWKVSFLSGSKVNGFTKDLKDRGIETYSIEPNDSRFNTLIAELNPDYVIFDRFVTEEQFGWRVKEFSPRSIRVIDTQDLHFLRRAREKNHRTGAILNLKTEDTFRELTSFYRSDGVLLISSAEEKLLLGEFQFPNENLHVLPFLYPKPTPCFSFENRKGFAFIGNFRHPPNEDAVRWLKTELWPEIRKELPEAELSIYGAYPSKEMMNFTDFETGFHVKGWAEDLQKALGEARVSLAPLRFGAGLKGKITESWFYGTPVVSTIIGAEGLKSFAGAVAKNPEEFIQACVTLYRNEEEWERASMEAILRIQNDFSQNKASAFIRWLGELEEKRQIPPKRDFMSQMLEYQGLRSSKYFSKWIEEKNRTQSRT